MNTLLRVYAVGSIDTVKERQGRVKITILIQKRRLERE